MNLNPMTSVVIADRIARLHREADQERLAALARSASNGGRSRRADRRTRYVGGVRMWFSDAVLAVARAVRADWQEDCPDEALVEPPYSPTVSWAWIRDRPNLPCP